MGTRKDGILQTDDVGGGGVGAAVDITTPIGSQLSADSLSVTFASDEPGLPISATDLDIRNLTFATDKVDASGSTVDTELPAPITLADNIVNLSAPAVGAFGMMFDGSTWDRVRGTSAAGILVNISNNPVPIGTGIDPSTVFQTTHDLFPIGALDYGPPITWQPVGSSFAPPASNLQGLGVRQVGMPAAAALADDVANPTVLSIGSYGFMFDGATWDRIKGDSTNGLLVNFGTNNDVIAQGGNVDLDTYIPGTSRVNLVAGEFDNGFTDLNPGEIGALRLTATRALHINPRDSFGNEIIPLTDTALRATPVPVTSTIIRPSTSVQTSVPDNAASVTILAANANRLGATILNTSTATLRLRLSNLAATTINYTAPLVSGAYYEVPFQYTGAITGIWDTDPGTGSALVTELTA
jgi:hypothetical protein